MQATFQNNKIMCFLLKKFLFNKVLPYLLYCKYMVKFYYIKGVFRVKEKKQKKASISRCFTE